MPRLNTAGSALCGIAGGEVSIDGSVPSELSTLVGGYWGWLSTTLIAGPGALGAGPWQVNQDNLSTHTVSTLDTHAPNLFGAGAGKWALWSPPTGIRSNVSGLSSLPAAGFGWVSRLGQVVIINTYASGTGITVYDATGAMLASLPSVLLTGPQIRLEDNILSYQDASGWHLLNVLTNTTPVWAPRTDAVVWVVPVQLGSTLVVVEAGPSLTCRQAARAQGYTIDVNPTFFNPDGMVLSAGVVRMAYAANAAESPDSLLETDLTLATGATVQGTVVAGSIVRVAGPTLTQADLPVGPLEGSDLTNGLNPPIQNPIVDPGVGYRATSQMASWMRDVGQSITTVSDTVQHTPVPPAPGPSFGIVSPPSPQPAVAAFSPGDNLALTSADTTIGFVATPPTKTVDLRVVPQGPDTAVQTNQGGVLSGDANLTWDAVNRVLTADGPVQLSSPIRAITSGGTGPGEVALTPGDVEFNDILLGGHQDAAGEFIPNGDILTDIFQQDFTPGSQEAGTELQYGLTPGVATPFTNAVGYKILTPTDTTGDPIAAMRAYQYGGLGTGAVPGMALLADRNDSGGGAASTMAGQLKDGRYFVIWADATGAMRYNIGATLAAIRPTEDGTVSDTSGFLFGTGSGGGSITNVFARRSESGRRVIQGVPGPAGAAGSPGTAGAAGALGPPGPRGSDGARAMPIPGPSGSNGINGTNGATGSPGPPGPRSSDGPTRVMLLGSQAPSSGSANPEVPIVVTTNSVVDTNYCWVVSESLEIAGGVSLEIAGGARVEITGSIYVSIGARLNNSSNQSLLNATPTALTFNTETYDFGGLYNAARNTRLTALVSGIYQIFGTCSFSSNSTGFRRLQCFLNGISNIVITDNPANASAATTNVSISASYYLNRGDYVELFARQDSGGTLNSIASIPTNPTFGMTLVQ
jgi:hypothetical protein